MLDTRISASRHARKMPRDLDGPIEHVRLRLKLIEETPRDGFIRAEVFCVEGRVSDIRRREFGAQDGPVVSLRQQAHACASATPLLGQKMRQAGDGGRLGGGRLQLHQRPQQADHGRAAACEVAPQFSQGW